MKTYRITYETTASITAYVGVPNDVKDSQLDDYVSETSHEAIEAHLQTLDGSYANVIVSIDASIDGDGGGPVELVQ